MARATAGFILLHMHW